MLGHAAGRERLATPAGNALTPSRSQGGRRVIPGEAANSTLTFDPDRHDENPLSTWA